jgi:hypothetical protein
VGYFWYRRRKKRLQQEKELEVKNTELKYSKKVHDKVANKVYHVMSEVENIPVIDKTNCWISWKVFIIFPVIFPMMTKTWFWKKIFQSNYQNVEIVFFGYH